MAQAAWDSNANRAWDDPEALDQQALQQQLGGPGGGVASPLPSVPDRNDLTRTSVNAPRVRQNAQGGWELREHGNTRQLAGDDLTRAREYESKFWSDNPTGWQANNPQTMNDIYQQTLGRAPDAPGLAAHAKNPGGFTGAVNAITGSPEAMARRAPPITSMGLQRQAPSASSGYIPPGSPGSATGGATTTPPPVAPPVTPPPTATTTPPPAAGVGRARTGAAPAGFNQGNWDDPKMQSVKYAAGSFLNGVTRPSEVAAIVNSPEFQARFPGARFNGKDMVDFAGALSDGTSGVPVGMVDVLKSADAGADASEGFWWGANPAGGDVVPTDGGGGDGAPVVGQGGGVTTMPIDVPGSDQSYLDEIMKEIDALAAGNSGLDQRALLQQLQ